jgi:hypothetical protein
MKRLGASVPAITAAGENPKVWITMRNVAAASTVWTLVRLRGRVQRAIMRPPW